MTINDKIFEASERFYIEGKLREQDVDGTYFSDLLYELLRNEEKHGKIYEFKIDTGWMGSYNKILYGYIAVSWMEEHLRQIVFKIEED